MGIGGKRWLMAMFTAIVAISRQVSSSSDECSCVETDCEDPGICFSGAVLDTCNCCKVCSRSEGQLCDMKEDTSQNFGFCGKNLECRINPETDVGKSMMETLCYCLEEDLVCGSDGKTYENICQLEAASVNQTSYGEPFITVQHQGKPCPSAPWIVGSKEERHFVEVGKPFALICEGFGYPVPTVEWYKEGEEDMTLPCDYEDIAIQARGGPEKYQVTSWIQFQSIQKSHQGRYWCVAKNTHGEAKVVIYIGAQDKEQQAETNSWYETELKNRRADYLKYYGIL